MDKKRRKKTSTENEVVSQKNKCTLHHFLQCTNTSEECGIVSKKYKCLGQYGLGSIDFHYFDGLSVSISDLTFKDDVNVELFYSQKFLELSFLIEGEQIIKIKGLDNDVVYESQESYLVYLSNVKGLVSYHQRKPFREVKIRMDIHFIQKHRLNEEYNILDRHELQQQHGHLIRPLCIKTQEILSEILSDRRKGLLKRLFLESKTLELIALQLDNESEKKHEALNPIDNLVKKLYKTQFIISSDLSVQYSIQQLSRQIGLNDFILKKEFKRLFGKTIFEYSTELRMEKAKQLLHHSKKPIYEISELVGYKNSTHFSAAFKKIEGITPKRFRNNKET